MDEALDILRELIHAVPHYVDPTNPRVHVFGGGDGVDTKKDPCPLCRARDFVERSAARRGKP